MRGAHLIAPMSLLWKRFVVFGYIRGIYGRLAKGAR
jgi:hypothetical protein